MVKDKLTIAEVRHRLMPDKAKLLLEGVRSLNRQYNFSHGLDWVGYIDWFKIAQQISMHPSRAAAVAARFEELGLQEARNNYDGWVSTLGVLVAIDMDPSLARDEI